MAKNGLFRTIAHALANPLVLLLLLGAAAGVFGVFLGHMALRVTSSDAFCDACHVHPQATWSWKKGTHFKNEAGMVIHCVECHLPPGGPAYLYHKARLGIRDVWGTLVRDPDTIDWEAKSVLEYAVTHTFDDACRRCHEDLYSLGLSPKGVRGHEYYLEHKDEIRCINCHLTVGHHHEKTMESVIPLAGGVVPERPVHPPSVGTFSSYTETIPGTDVTFSMIAAAGGTFTMGSPEDELYRDDDEAQTRTTVAPFWIGEIEVTWDEFDAFYAARGTGRKTTGESVAAVVDKVVVDAVTGPTPPYGSPDQSWGKGLRPVITMTHHAAEVYCAWLSKITGDEYRLPTEAEWEYACRGGADGPYWFEADPKAVSERSLWNRWFGAEDTVHPYAWYDRNSGSRTQPPYALQPNPLGLYAMLGNVWELTATPYSPEGPGTGGASIESTGGVIEYAIRGGSYRSDPADLRSAEREPTRHDRWLLTDPQLPKSIWWYSDTREVGFRIVRTYRGD